MDTEYTLEEELALLERTLAASEKSSKHSGVMDLSTYKTYDFTLNLKTIENLRTRIAKVKAAILRRDEQSQTE